MATINELKEVLKETLENRGVLSGIRAQLRSEIFNALNDKPKEKKPLSNENLIINELIREYMLFNGYGNALSVFLPESGQPESPPFDRNYIAKTLKLKEDQNSKELPLIYGLTFGLKKLVMQEREETQKLPEKEIIEEAKATKIGKTKGENIFNIEQPEGFGINENKK